jgi:uncharacterized membrane protein
MNEMRMLAAFGLVLTALALAPLLSLFKDWVHFAAITVLAAVGYGVYEACCRMRLFKRSAFAAMALTGQSLDGGATLVGVALLKYSEQHVLANAIFSIGSPLLFYFVKVAFGVLACKAAASRESEEGNYLLALVAVLGWGPGLRDALRILAGV